MTKPSGFYRWLLAALLVAVALSIASVALDATYWTRTGLRYALTTVDPGSADATAQQGITDGLDLGVIAGTTAAQGHRFEILWSGYWFVPETGLYEIFCGGNGRVVLTVDDERLVYRSSPVDPSFSSRVIRLAAGYHRLRVSYRYSILRPRMVVHWAPQGGSPRPPASEALFPKRHPVKRYWRNQRLLRLREAAVACWILVGLLAIAASVSAMAPRWRVALSGFRRRLQLPAVLGQADALVWTAAIGSGFLVLATLFQHELDRTPLESPAWWLNLQREHNVAVWWSSALLLLAALFAVDARDRWREASRSASMVPAILRERNHRAAQRGWTSLAIVLAALSADEVGQFHEVMDRLLGWGTWWSLLPFAIVLLALVAVTIVAFFSVQPLRGLVVFLLLGFAVLGSVPLLEYAEHNVRWGPAQHWSHPNNLRAVIEEGAELLGIFILLRVCAAGRRRTGMATHGGGFENPAASLLRQPLLLGGWIFVPLAAYASVRLPRPMDPASWVTTAILLVAAIASISGRQQATGTNRALGSLALAGSIAATSIAHYVRWQETLWTSFWLTFAVLLVLAARSSPWTAEKRFPGWAFALTSLFIGASIILVDRTSYPVTRLLLPQVLGLLTLYAAPTTRSGGPGSSTTPVESTA